MASFAAFDVVLPVQVFGASSETFSGGESVVTEAGETEQNTIEECSCTISTCYCG